MQGHTSKANTKVQINNFPASGNHNIFLKIFGHLYQPQQSVSISQFPLIFCWQLINIDSQYDFHVF